MLKRFIVRCRLTKDATAWVEYWVAARDKARAGKFIDKVFPALETDGVLDMDDPEDIQRSALRNPDLVPMPGAGRSHPYFLGIAISPVNQGAVRRLGSPPRARGRRKTVPQPLKEDVKKASKKKEVPDGSSLPMPRVPPAGHLSVADVKRRTRAR